MNKLDERHLSKIITTLQSSNNIWFISIHQGLGDLYNALVDHVECVTACTLSYNILPVLIEVLRVCVNETDREIHGKRYVIFLQNSRKQKKTVLVIAS